MNVMWSSRLFRVSLFLENASILMIWGCFSIVSNVIRSNYCCRRHTMHGNMVFSRESIFPTPQQSGCLCVCIVKPHYYFMYHCYCYRYHHRYVVVEYILFLLLLLLLFMLLFIMNICYCYF